MKKSLRDKMEEASLHELMPDFDKQDGWKQLSAHLHTSAPKQIWNWKRAAAILLLVAGAGIVSLLTYSNYQSDNPLAIADTGTMHNWANDVSPAVPKQHTYANEDADHSTRKDTNGQLIAGNENAVQKPEIENRTQQSDNVKPTLQLNETHRTKEFVCNGTACPIEICIIQKIHCKNQKPSAISTCNTLEPDQARQLHYKAPNSAGANCKVTVEEITITRVSTGETIVLNAHSKPSTAQELFNCITGHEKCELLAGIFETDCNNQQKSHSLKIDNNFGNLTVQ
jgi:hypothetical protein